MGKNGRANRRTKRQKKDSREKARRARRVTEGAAKARLRKRFEEAMAYAFMDVSFETIATELPDLVQDLSRFERIAAVALIAGLATMPQYQERTLRIEVLTALATWRCKGSAKPKFDDLARWYQAIGQSRCVRGEDPSEDIFTDMVHRSHASKTILPGLWESAAFHTQRSLEALEHAPEELISITTAIEALLTVSHLVCEKSKLERYTDELGADSLALEPIEEEELGSRVSLSDLELEQAGISRAQLEPFLNARSDVLDLSQQRWGESTLEEKPLLETENGVILALPTAVSIAVRTHIIRHVLKNRLNAQFDEGLMRSYAKLFAQARILGDLPGVPATWQKVDRSFLASASLEYDEGRHLVLHFLLPSVEAHRIGGFTQTLEFPQSTVNSLAASIASQTSKLSQDSEFRSGLHVVVSCGWGLGSVLSLPPLRDPRWQLDILPAADFITVGEVEGMSAGRLDRILSAKADMNTHGVRFHNLNGTLNLLGWLQHNDWQMVPHERLEDGRVSPETPLVLVPPTNLLRDIRVSVARAHESHVQLGPDGEPHFLRRVDRSFFETPQEEQLFLSVNSAKRGHFVAVHEGASTIWIHLETPNIERGDLRFRLWEVLRVWLPRVTRTLSSQTKLPPEVSLTICFEESSADFRSLRSPEKAEGRDLYMIDERTRGSARITLQEGFASQFRLPTNTAERILVSAMLEALHQTADPGVSVPQELLEQVVRNDYARSFHLFTARTFADHVTAPLPGKLLVGDPIDHGRIRLGIAWKVHQGGNFVEGAKNCKKLLNALVDVLLEDLTEGLSKLDRESTILRLLHNHEKAHSDQEHWRKTSKALLALYGEEKALGPVVSESSEKSTAMVLSRCLIEMAVSMAPITGGRRPAQAELEHLLSTMALLIQIGGFSDGIHFGVLQPYLRISPLGDVLIADELGNEVVEPLLKRTIETRYLASAPKQDANYAEIDPSPQIRESFEPEFWSAWESEVGFDIDDARKMIDATENRALSQSTYVLRVTRSELENLLTASSGREKATAFMAQFTLSHRKKWSSPPNGELGEIYPWRFGRKLSLVTRPMLELTDATDPVLLVSPTLLRLGFGIVLSGAYHGTLRPEFFRTEALAKLWRAKAQEGHSFNKEVTQALADAGWETRENVTLPEILQTKLEEDVGDVDVLAWDAASQRVLVIECKALNARRNYSEIAAQLSEYQGKENDGEKDKLLKHLTRLTLLEDNLGAVSKVTGIKNPQLVSCLVVANPAPMQFATTSALSSTFVGTVRELLDEHRRGDQAG